MRSGLTHNGHDVWSALAAGAPNLRHLKVQDDCEFNSRHDRGIERINDAGEDALAPILPIHDSSLFDHIKGLHSFDWYSESYMHGPDVPSDRLVQFLAASPQLQVSGVSVGQWVEY